MATQLFTRSLLFKPQSLTSLVSRSVCSLSFITSHSSRSPSSVSLLRRLRPLCASFSSPIPQADVRRLSLRCFATRETSSSLNDPNPNWSNRPPKETILLDGCDFEHWLVVMEKPEGDPTRDEIIDKYIKTLAQVVGSEEEARMKIYSVSTRCYYAFGCLVSEELSYKLKELAGVRWVLPDSYLDVKNKDYGGEPFINGQAVPYDPKYHEEWIRNNARANERNRRNDRPRNFDRSRNFERRRENMQNRDFQNNPIPNQGMQNNPMQNRGMPHNPIPNRGMPNNPMPNQQMPNHPNQGMPNYPNQGIPNYPNQGIPSYPMPNQGMQNNPLPNQGMQTNPMPHQGMQNNPLPNQGMQTNPMPHQGMQNPGYGNMDNAKNGDYEQGYGPNSNMPNSYPRVG